MTGIDSADDYLRLAAGLREVPVVRTVTPLHASAGQLELSVEMTTGLAGFNRMLGDNGVLVPVRRRRCRPRSMTPPVPRWPRRSATSTACDDPDPGS